MKKSVIKDIFNGFRGHYETLRMTRTEEYQKNTEIASDAYEELKKKLSPELFELHERLTEVSEKNACNELDFHFVEGFKLGLLIGIECMEE